MKQQIYLSLFFLCCVGGLSAQEITFMTHNVEGKVYQDANGQLRGIEHSGRRAFNIELIREMMLLMKHPVKFTVVPFKRGLREVKLGKNIALFNVDRTPSREKSYKWVGPLQADEVYFYQSIDNPVQIESLEDAKKVRSICIYRGFHAEKYLRERGFKNIILAESPKDCLDMLFDGTAHLVPLAEALVRSAVKVSRMPANDLQKIPVVVNQVEGYIIFSRAQDDKTIAAWQDALDQLKASGRYQALKEKYLLDKE